MDSAYGFKTGFTIVELLIVIVVIGILASITLVAYSGVQARAERVKTVAAVRDYVTALSTYRALNGRYPSTSTVCLGLGYTDQAGDSRPDCRWGSGTVSVDSSFNTELATAAQVPHSVTQRPVRSGSASVVGMYFMNDSLGRLDGAEQTNWLVYVVPDKKCGLSLPLLGNTYPEFTSKSDDSVSENWGSGGLCWYPLPQ